jgi:hemerythrin-like domain-containing protein
MERSESPLLGLYLSYDEWKEEHNALHARLLELCRLMKWKPGNREHPDWASQHRKVKEEFIPFMQDWQRHLSRERDTIYPMAKSVICGGKMGPVAVLEQDGRIAEQFYDGYLQAVKEGASSEDTLYRLLQVLMIIAEHFRVEDETVVPAADRLMQDRLIAEGQAAVNT